MMVVEYQGMRWQLIAHLKQLSDSTFQKNTWIGNNQSLQSQVPSFSDAVQFILDTRLGDDPYIEIGVILENEDEAKAIQLLHTALLNVITAVGKNMPDEAYITHSLWNNVLNAACNALVVISKEDNFHQN